MNIYVGNLPWETREEDLRKVFSEYGQVTAVRIITDAFSGKSRGFGFVEMENRDQAQAAINAMNNKEFNGRSLRVNEAQPKGEGGPGKKRNFEDKKRW